MSLFRRGPDPRDALIEHLTKVNADLLDRLQELVGSIHYHQVDAASKRAKTDYQPPRAVSEEEQDLRWAADAGEISPEDLEDALRALNFDNSELEVFMP